MNELIKIETNSNGESIVSGRELHEFLESKQDFSDWIKNRIEKYGFVEDIDFTINLWKSTGGDLVDCMAKFFEVPIETILDKYKSMEKIIIE